MVRVVKILVSLFQTNCYLVIHEETNEGFLIDPGDYADVILSAVEKEGVTLTGIYLTHGHLDHMRAVERIRLKYPVPVYAQSYELEVLENPEINLTRMFLRKDYVLTGVLPLADEREVCEAGIRMRVIHTPGHTKGGCCYYLFEEGILFSGDTLFYRSVGNTAFPGGSAAVLERSILEQLYVLPENTVVYPGHGEPTDIGSEMRENPFVTADGGSSDW